MADSSLNHGNIPVDSVAYTLEIKTGAETSQPIRLLVNWDDILERPVATSELYGLVKLGSDTKQIVAMNSPSFMNGRTYPVQFNDSDQMVVNIPWSNTTYSAGNGLKLNGTVFSVNTGFTTTGKKYKVEVDSTTKGLYVNVPWENTITDVSGLITGPNSSTDNAIVRFDGTDGKAVQNSGITISDTNAMEWSGNISIFNNKTDNAGTKYKFQYKGTDKLTISDAGAVVASSTIQGTQLKSTVGVGTAPLTVNSTTIVSNLNADLLDGKHSTDFASSTHKHSVNVITDIEAEPVHAATDVTGDVTVVVSDHSYTPQGTVSAPIFTGTKETIKHTATSSHTLKYKAVTSISTKATDGEVVGSISTSSESVLNKATLGHEYTSATQNVTLTFGTTNVGVIKTVTSTPKKAITAVTVSSDSNEQDVTGDITVTIGDHSYIPVGTVSKPTFTGTASTIKHTVTPSHTLKYDKTTGITVTPNRSDIDTGTPK